jgi:ABC-type multidrug transport system fused ATPase/permease subunit
MIPYSYFFRYCSPKDKFMLTIGTISLFLAGGFLPSIALFLNPMLNSLNPTNTGTNTYSVISWVAKWMTVIACGELVASYIYYALWQHVACNITYDLRNRYVKKLLT